MQLWRLWRVVLEIWDVDGDGERGGDTIGREEGAEWCETEGAERRWSRLLLHGYYGRWGCSDYDGRRSRLFSDGWRSAGEVQDIDLYRGRRRDAIRS